MGLSRRYVGPVKYPVTPLRVGVCGAAKQHRLSLLADEDDEQVFIWNEKPIKLYRRYDECGQLNQIILYRWKIYFIFSLKYRVLYNMNLYQMQSMYTNCASI